MKKISIVGLLFVLGACSTHAVKCQGPLRPINEPNSQSAGSQERGGSADPLRSVPQP